MQKDYANRPQQAKVLVKSKDIAKGYATRKFYMTAHLTDQVCCEIGENTFSLSVFLYWVSLLNFIELT